MGGIRWLLGGPGELYISFFLFFSFLPPMFIANCEKMVLAAEYSANANSTRSAGGAVTAMGVTADLIKVIQRVS